MMSGMADRNTSPNTRKIFSYASIAACACTARGLKRLNLWDKLGENRLDSGESALVSQLAGECVAQTTRN